MSDFKSRTNPGLSYPNFEQPEPGFQNLHFFSKVTIITFIIAVNIGLI